MIALHTTIAIVAIIVLIIKVKVDQIIALLLRLNAAGTAVIMIEHIMRAVTAFAERLIVFVAGRKIADGPPQEVLALREVEDAYLGKQ